MQTSTDTPKVRNHLQFPPNDLVAVHANSDIDNVVDTVRRRPTSKEVRRWEGWRSAHNATCVHVAVPAGGQMDDAVVYYLLKNASAGQLPTDQVDLAVEVFRMLADVTRVQILWALIEGELSVGDLAERTGKAPASVSQHLAKLRMARLVRPRREGTTVFYRLDNDHVSRLITDAVYNAEHAGPRIPGHHHDDAVTHLGADPAHRSSAEAKEQTR